MNYADYVCPLQGTNSIFKYSNGNTLPMISRPFGMNSWALQTRKNNWFFHPEDKQLEGIRLTHQPSPWIGDYGHLTLMPQVGDKAFPNSESWASAYRLEDSDVRPYCFKTNLLRYQTSLEMVPSDRCMAMRVDYPANKPTGLYVQLFEGAGEIKWDRENNQVIGWTHSNHKKRLPENFKQHFVLKFDTTIEDVVFIDGDKRQSLEESVQSSNGLNCLIKFGHVNKPLNLHFGASYIDVEQAFRNLEDEIGDLSLEELKIQSKEVWNEELTRIEIETDDENELKTFYTCLYRTFLFPRKFYEVNDKKDNIHYSPYSGKVHKGVLYADNGFWDTHRTVYPLYSILFPNRLGEILEGWTNAAKEGGWYPKWSGPGYLPCMISTHIDVVISDAYAKGIRNFDVASAYQYLKKNAFEQGNQKAGYGREDLEMYLDHGYLPDELTDHSVSKTLDYAHCDWAIAQMAKEMGTDEEYDSLIKRANYYQNIFDDKSKFMRAKDSAGAWIEPFDEFDWGGPYVEGSVWQCGWSVPHDPKGLIDLLGGDKEFLDKFKDLLELPPHFNVIHYPNEIHEMTEMASVDFGQYAHSNQPSHHLLYLFTCAGKPEITQKWVRKTLDELYSHDINGLAGDEDNGEMSAWYVLNSMGIYPLCPGHPSYVFGSPLFKKMKIHLENGKCIRIEAENNSKNNVFVESIEINGKITNNTWIAHEDLVNADVIKYKMTDEPDTNGRVLSGDELPYSFSNE